MQGMLHKSRPTLAVLAMHCNTPMPSSMVLRGATRNAGKQQQPSSRSQHTLAAEGTKKLAVQVKVQPLLQ